MRRDSERSDLTPDERDVVGKPGDLVSEDLVPPRSRASSVMVSLRIDRQTFDQLSDVAEQRGETFSTTARVALRAFLGQRRASETYPERDHRPAARKVSEDKTRTWRDEDLRGELARYEAVCRRNDMRDKTWRSYVDYARRFLDWREGDYQPRGTIAGDRPVPRTSVSSGDLRRQAQEYAERVMAAGRKQPTVDTYLRHAMFFIRWLEGEFEPGARLRGLR